MFPRPPNTTAVHVGDDQKADKLGANDVGINCWNGLWNNGRRTIISVPLLVLTMEALLWSCQKEPSILNNPTKYSLGKGTQGSGSGGWDGGGGVGKIFEKYHVGGGFVSTVNEAAMVV
ncbi:hypothetical protein Tco_0168429 [Tanacetum coccineum]